jgi:hypothetical protein
MNTSHTTTTTPQKETRMMIEPTATIPVPPHNFVDGRIVVMDPQPTSMDITIVDDGGEALIVRLGLDDLQHISHFTKAVL